jgi:hypothetical protein
MIYWNGFGLGTRWSWLERMDDVLSARCSSIWDSVLSSPIGTEVLARLSAASSDLSRPILAIRDALDEEQYASIADWLRDVRDVFQRLARDFGAESDIGLSVLTLLQLVEEEAAGLTPKSIPMGELDQIIAEFEQIVARTPNSFAEFMEELNAASPPIPELPIVPGSTPFTDSSAPTPDTFSVYQDVVALETDKDLERIVDIVSRYETAYSHTNDVIEIDLTQCQPHTLRLIHNYVKEAKKRK